MNQETVQAESSAATPAVEPDLEIPRSGTPEYAEWRKSGKLPEKTQDQPKPEESAPSDAPKETESEAEPDSEAESSPAPEAAQKQEKRSNADTRKSQLTAEIKELLKQRDALKSEISARQTPPAESSKAESERPQNYQQWRKSFRPSQWMEDYAKANPEASYEDQTAAMADYLGDVREQFRAFEQRAAEQRQSIERAAEDARQRYGDGFDAARNTFTSATLGSRGEPLVPVEVLSLVSDSDVLADLVYTIGSNAEETAKFAQMAKTNPNKAIRYIALTENLIREELSKATPRNEQGRFAKEEPPAKRGPESAPEPPIEIGNRGSKPMDESERAFSAIERGDPKAVRAWIQAENAKELRRRKGM